MSLFGGTTVASTSQTPSNPFAAAGNSLFGTAQPSQQQGTSLFGATTTSQPPQQSGSLFGSSTQNQAPQPGGSLFGNALQQPQQQGGGLFGSAIAANQTKPGGLGLFGSLGNTSTQQPQQQQQQTQAGGLFGSLGQSTQQQQAQPQAQQQQQILGQSRIWTEQDGAPRQKSITEQIELVFSKWNPESPNGAFQTYLYTQVDPREAPFYRPSAGEDEDKWEEALRNQPNDGAIPVIVKGFQQLGLHIVQQGQHLSLLHGRLHEINNGLTALLQQHDLKIAVRATECRRRHLRLSHKCLTLATKTQILKNRGYALDSVEEQLRQKLLELERSVFDPEVSGRGEEIWARMVMVREQGRQLEVEFAKAGRSLKEQQTQPLDEETVKRAKKILEDYDSQLSHLSKELGQIKKDYEEWEQSRPSPNGLGYSR